MPLEPIDESNADPRTAATLRGVRGRMGFVPNLLRTMAHAPAVMESYLSLSEKFATTSLTPAERQVVLLAVSQINGCEYCMAAHAADAAGQNVDGNIVEAARDDRPIADAKLEALRRFTQDVVRMGGRPEQSQRDAFVAAGYSEAQMLEVVLGVAMKTLSNYTNHMTKTPIDTAFVATH